MNKSSNTSVEHMAKQKKRKNLSDEMVYSSLNKIVEMHKLGELKLSSFDNKTINLLFSELIEGNEKLNTRVDNTKMALTTILNRIEIIEGKMKTYGLE